MGQQQAERMDAVRQILKTYAKSVRGDLAANPPAGGAGADVEPMLHDRFRTLVESLLPLIFAKIPVLPNVSVEWRADSIGRPDIAFSRAGLACSFVELKAPEKSITPRKLKGHDKEQFARFSNLPAWALSNFHEITLYARDEPQIDGKVVPAAALDPGTSDAKADGLIDIHDPRGFLDVLGALVLARPKAPKTAKEMAHQLAYSARFVKDVARDLAQKLLAPSDNREEEERRCNEDLLYAVREEFRRVLYERPAALGHRDDEDFNSLFAVAFAQTLAYGLLLAREEAEDDIGLDAHTQVDETAHPLLRATLRALLQEEVQAELGPALSVLIETVNAADPKLLVHTKGRDPILYFYEDFLKVFEEGLWKRFGVIYTPVEVVEYQVAAVQRALEAIGTQGLLDPKVLLLDPACGTGTYLIAAAEAAGEIAEARFGGAAAAGEVRSLTRRLYGLEIMVGPYAVAHYRLARALKSIGAEPEKKRLNIFLADTLAPAGGEKEVQNPLGFLGKPIVEERTRADEVKREKPVLAIFGNPPYRRLREGETYGLVGPWVVDQLWERYRAPVRQAGWGGELKTFSDLYVAFFAWSQWKLFWRDGAPRRGALCLITNRSYLTGKPFAGLRQWLRKEFDQIDILDLRGDTRGARPAGIDFDENVFDVEVGVAVIVAWAIGNKPQDSWATVRYADAWMHNAFSRDEKSELLRRATLTAEVLTFLPIAREPLDDFRPLPFEGRDWTPLNECFLFWKSGIKTQRDNLVVGWTREDIESRIAAYKLLPIELRLKNFWPQSEKYDKQKRQIEGSAFGAAFQRKKITSYAYRPFDRRLIYLDERYVNRHGPKLRAVLGEANVALYAMPYKTGAGPAAVVHASWPDYHAFRGSYGGYAFPLYDRRPGSNGFNLDLRLVRALSERYQTAVTPEEVFDATVALLSSPSYARRFAADLEDAFPHVPFPSEVHVLRQAAEIGARVRSLQTFDLQPEDRFWTARLEGDPKDRTLAVPRIGSAFLDQGNGFGTIRLNATLRLERVPTRVWEFAVSGYRVVYRWVEARNGLSLDEVMDEDTGETLQRQLLDLVARVAAYIDACESAEPVLEATLASPLTKNQLTLFQQALL